MSVEEGERIKLQEKIPMEGGKAASAPRRFYYTSTAKCIVLVRFERNLEESYILIPS